MRKPVNISTFAAVKTFCLTLKTIKGMKKLMHLALAFIAIATGFTACTNSVNNVNNREFASIDNDVVHVLQLGDSLFGLEYVNYDFKKCRQYFDSLYSPKGTLEDFGACSEVRIKNFVGRNLDYYINNNACAVIKIQADKESGRLASIGVVGCFNEFTYDRAKNDTMPSRFYHCLPGRTVDGINEKGVYIGVNVLPKRPYMFGFASIPEEETDFKAYYNTNNLDYYNALYLTRFVLDNATSVKDAIERIKQHNWYFPNNYPNSGNYQPFHWMISDGKLNCILEFENGNIVPLFAEGDNLSRPNIATIMTNFSNNLKKQKKMDPLGVGYERYDIIKDKYPPIDFIPSMDKILEIMKSVWFSNAYTLPFSKDDYDKFWLTELSNEYVSSDKLYHKGKEIVDNPLICDAINIYRGHWNDKNRWFRNNTDLWYTVHTSVYDLDNLTLFVLPHEGGKTATDHQPKQIGRKFSLEDKLDVCDKQNP